MRRCRLAGMHMDDSVASSVGRFHKKRRPSALIMSMDMMSSHCLMTLRAIILPAYHHTASHSPRLTRSLVLIDLDNIPVSLAHLYQRSRTSLHLQNADFFILFFLSIDVRTKLLRPPVFVQAKSTGEAY
jgi:hypothetical protein